MIVGAREAFFATCKEILIIAKWSSLGAGTRGTMLGVALRAESTHLRTRNDKSIFIANAERRIIARPRDQSHRGETEADQISPRAPQSDYIFLRKCHVYTLIVSHARQLPRFSRVFPLYPRLMIFIAGEARERKCRAHQ